MKRFLWIDESGRGFTADMSEPDVRAAMVDGGEFAEYVTDEDDETAAESIVSWVDRCDVGAEFDLDAARLVCIADDGERYTPRPVVELSPHRADFVTVETANGRTVQVYERSTMALVAKIDRCAFGYDAPGGGSFPRDNATASRLWRELISRATA